MAVNYEPIDFGVSLGGLVFFLKHKTLSVIVNKH